MADKKANAADSTPEDEALQKRVEMIMGERNADGETPAKRDQSPTGEPAIDIFKDPKTAPAVPPHLLEQIGAAPKEPAKPAAQAVASDAAPVQAAATKSGTPAGIDDEATDNAVDDIARTDSDAMLAAEDQAAGASTPAVKKPAAAPGKGWKAKLGGFFKSKWFWIGLGAIVIAVFAVPYTRYTVLGLFIKTTVTVNVTDSKNHTPVSTAAVSFGGETRYTNGEGKVQLQVPLGQHTLAVTKQYYQSYHADYLASFKSGQTANVSLVATGRQVPVTVVDKITGKPLADARIYVVSTTANGRNAAVTTSAKTDGKGKATVVLPTNSASDKATINLSGYNETNVTITVTDQTVPANTFGLVASGQIYFLSNQSGKIDVVKTNLDGSNRKTVLAGTGSEDPNATSLLASRDWHYVALKSQRDSGTALYLINTSNDKITKFDSGADLNLIGWYGHTFLYDVVRSSVSSWTSGHEAVKGYNADTGQLNLIDQNQAEGTSTAYAYQGFYNFFVMDGLLTYNTQWYTYSAGGSSYDLSNKNNTIRGVQPTGQAKKDYQSYPAAGVGYTQAVLFEPNGAYYAVYNYNDNKTTYYKFENQAVTTVTNLSQATFNQAYPTYLLSPSGSQTFWAEQRDGKNTLFTGDDNAQTQKQIATLSDYSPYGWYTDNYLLVSKGGSELYVMAAGGGAAFKITDYYKAAQSYQSYGYGYGGL